MRAHDLTRARQKQLIALLLQAEQAFTAPSSSSPPISPSIQPAQ